MNNFVRGLVITEPVYTDRKNTSYSPLKGDAPMQGAVNIIDYLRQTTNAGTSSILIDLDGDSFNFYYDGTDWIVT